MRRSLAACALVLVAGCGAVASHSPPAYRAVRANPASRPPTPVATTPPASPSAPAVNHPVTAAATKRVIIAGDSIPEDLGPMVTSALASPRFSGHTESHASSGIVRDDYFDWPAAARRIGAERPDTVIVMLGGNDNQPIKPAGAPYALPATPRWDAEYARRVGLVMDALRAGGVQRIYWLTMPTTTRSSMNAAVAAMGQAVHLAAKGRSYVTVYDTDRLLAADAGTGIAHQRDGIHLSTLGSQLVANSLIAQLRIDAATRT